MDAAVADLGYVYATTARERDMAKSVVGPRDAAARLAGGDGVQKGVLFGRERSGLTNDEVALADEILTLPVNPEFSSLNIAQAVLVVAYEWRLAMLGSEDAGMPFTGPPAEAQASKADLIHLFEHLESALDAVGFFRPPEKRPHMVRSLRTILQRARLSDQEVRTLRGVVAALERRPTRPPRGGAKTATPVDRPGSGR